MVSAFFLPSNLGPCFLSAAPNRIVLLVGERILNQECAYGPQRMPSIRFNSNFHFTKTNSISLALPPSQLWGLQLSLRYPPAIPVGLLEHLRALVNTPLLGTTCR